MKNSKRAPGAFLRIKLSDGTFGYARVRQPPYTAFYDFQTQTPISDLELIASRPVLFTLGIRAISMKHWEYIGISELQGEVTLPVMRYTQDIGNFRNCTIYDGTGMVKDVTPEECIGLERAASWEAEQVEERLLDAFMGRPNEGEIRLRVRLSGTEPDAFLKIFSRPFPRPPSAE